MAFRKISHANRRIQMVGLIDLIFILLIFFIITSIMIKLTRGESKLHIPTPKNEPGEAQVLIQILENDNYFWLDHTAIDTLNRYSFRFRNPASVAPKIQLLLNKMTLSREELDGRIDALVKGPSANRQQDYFVMIRCPDNLPYSKAVTIIEKLVDLPNFEYGCVSGTVDDLVASKNIQVRGNVLQIDFE